LLTWWHLTIRLIHRVGRELRARRQGPAPDDDGELSILEAMQVNLPPMALL
jgi:hypothetical protein